MTSPALRGLWKRINENLQSNPQYEKAKTTVTDTLKRGADTYSTYGGVLPQFLPLNYLEGLTQRPLGAAYTTRDVNQQQFFGKTGGDLYDTLARANDVVGGMDNPAVTEFWNSLSDNQRRAILHDNYETRVDDVTNLWGLLGAKQTFDFEAFQKDLESLVNYDWAEEPVYSDFYDKALSEVDAEFVPIFERYAEQERMLDELRATRQAEYAEDLNSIRQEYGAARQGILSQQAAQNARLSDTMTSQMERSRRNALEAGASAGIRLAGNVNAMLSSQNQMAQTSLDTSNQLAQMLLNQRNAERGARTAYNSYMDQDMRDRAALDANRSDLELSRVDRATGRAQSQYAQAQDDYANRQAYQDNYFANNSLTDSYEQYRTGGKYSK